jgi:hypothetical protein
MKKTIWAAALLGACFAALAFAAGCDTIYLRADEVPRIGGNLSDDELAVLEAGGSAPQIELPTESTGGVVTLLELGSVVTAPVRGAAPSTEAIDAAQYTGTVAWQAEDGAAFAGEAFLAAAVYQALVTLQAKDTYTFTGLAEDAFSYSGADSVKNAADSGVVTITFPATAAEGELNRVNMLALDRLVTAPEKDAAPVTDPFSTTQYRGAIAWQLEDGTPFAGSAFMGSTVYRVRLSLSARTGFTFTGLPENAFTYTGAASVTNAANSGTVFITFPAVSDGGMTNGVDADGVPIFVKNDITRGTGKIESVGPASGEGGTKTYYIDYANGSDTAKGTSPLTPWKTFKNTYLKVFNPGDHILLEADCIWNGVSVTPTNKDTLLASNKAGMMYPKGSGTEGNPIVIDLYDIKFINQDGSRSETYDSDTVKGYEVFFSADQRPLINGNGTPSFDPLEPYKNSAPITLVDVQYWEVRNIEATNTFTEFATYPLHWQSMGGGKELGSNLNEASTTTPAYKTLAGILVEQIESTQKTHIVIEGCYVHNVQGETNNNSKPIYKSTYFGTQDEPGKMSGGIIVNGNYNDLSIMYNIIKGVSLEGTRTGGGNKDNTRFEGNYIEHVMGDGIVIASVDKGYTAPGGNKGGFVVSNIIKNSCAGNTFEGNYAACWAYNAVKIMFEYNEAYGSLYGWNDGTAWDVDSACSDVTYQYNYSHHNQGGAILFMSGSPYSIFRYNISADEGGGTWHLWKLAGGTATTMTPSDTTYADGDPLKIASNVDSFTDFTGTTTGVSGTDAKGQSIIRYAFVATGGGASIPLIHNNTFYIGPNLSTAIYGRSETNSTGFTAYVRFYNNIVLKVREDDNDKSYVDMARAHGANNKTAASSYINNPAGFKNNMFYSIKGGAGEASSSALDGSFRNIQNGVNNFSSTLMTGNYWADPKLNIELNLTGGAAAMKTQMDAALPSSSFNDPAALKAFVDMAAVRERAKLFAPQSISPAIDGTNGYAVTTSSGTDLDGAAVTNSSTGLAAKDFFGTAIPSGRKHIGAAVGVYQ